MTTVSSCCTQGFEWDGKPTGREATIGGTHQAYVTGSNSNVAIMLIHDLFGWEFINNRLLADHYAREIDATVYVPDLYVETSFFKHGSLFNSLSDYWIFYLLEAVFYSEYIKLKTST